MTAPSTNTDNKTGSKDSNETNQQPGVKKQWTTTKQGLQSKYQNNKSGRFKGEIAALNGHVYEVHNETAKANQYQKTTKAISAYVNRTLKSGNDMMNMIDNMQDLNFDLLKPKAPSESMDEVDKMILQQEVNDFVKRRKLYFENRDKVFTIVWGQCSEALQAKLKGTKAFRTYNPIKCPISLLNDIKQVSLKFENVTFKAFAIYDAKMALANFYQSKQDTLHEYYMKFKDLIDALEHYGAEIGTDIGLIRDAAERDGRKDADTITYTDPNYDKYRAISREQYLAVCFLKGADRAKYGNLVLELENDYTKGTNHIPSTVADAYELLNRIKLPQKNPRNSVNGQGGNRGGKGNDTNASTEDTEVHGVVFVNKNGKPISKDVSCFACGGNHYKGDPACPKSKLNDDDDYLSSSFSVAFLGAQPTRASIADSNWILLDNQSSEHIFKNPDLVTNITALPPSQGLVIHSNGGSQFTFHQAQHKDVGTVWFNPQAITNILSFSKLRNAGHHLAYDYDEDIYTLKIENNTYVFRQSPEGLYIYYHNKNAITATTVRDKLRKYSPRQIAAADKARALYKLLGRPSDRVFKHMLDHNLIKNATVTSADVSRATDIYGPDIGSLKGKTVRATPASVKIPDIIPLPDEIRLRHRNVTVCADICHVDGLRFLTTISRHLHFGTIELVPSLEHSHVLFALKHVIHLYNSRGFNVQWLLTDRAFEHLRPALTSLNVHLNTTSANEHVPEIERFIRVIKERVRATVTTSPINPMPSLMKIHLIQHAVQLLNLTIQPNGVSDLLSPSSIVIGTQLDVNVHCRLEFGTYCQIHEEPTPSNNVNLPRTLDAIALRPIGNLQGGYYFLCLTTWRVLARRNWTPLPLPQHVLDLLHAKAHEERRTGPLYLRDDYFHFRRSDRSTITTLSADDSHLLLYPFVDEGANSVADSGALTPHSGAPIQQNTDADVPNENNNTDADVPNENNNADTSYSEDDVSDAVSDDVSDDDASGAASHPDDAVSFHDDDALDSDDIVDADASDSDDIVVDANDDNAPDSNDTSNPDELLDENPIILPPDSPADSLQATIQNTAPHQHNRNSAAKDTIHPEVHDDNIIYHEPEPDRPGTTRYNMRPKTVPKYAIDCMCYAKHGIALTGFSMGWACTQMTAKEGLKRFGKDAEDALLIEWKQLDRLKVYSGVHWNDLTPEERSRALRLVQLLKLKRCGRLRGRTCADGRKQRRYILPEDASSPTVSTEALLMTCVIDAKERRCVATADVPGAFLHAEMDDVVHVIVEGEQLQLLVKSNPAYKMFVHTDKRTGKERAYLRLHKALYGTLKAARLFYEDLSGHLEDMGFEANPYDPCVMNRNIQGSQCTIAWHVDDLKISHKSQAVVDRMLKRLSDIYGDLSITRGSKHTFVGMDLEFKNGEVTVGMESYLHESIEAFPEEITKKVNSPAASHLYDVNPNAKKLPEHLREIFHSIVAKLLFVATRGRPDLQPTISFLTSRCTHADEDDWKKLKRLLSYVKDTINLKLRLKASAMNIVMWWADAAFAVRDDYKSQSGRGMSFGTGMLQCKSNKQSTTENSSTTAELIASSDALVMIIWTTNFLKAQGYPIRDTILFQDNMSAIKLEKNGRQSSSKRTRHLNIRHFFIKDRVQAGELNIKHCGTDDMIADYLTKPLQGQKFKQFRDLILGITDIDSTDQIRSVLEEDLIRQNNGGKDQLNERYNLEEHTTVDLKYNDENKHNDNYEDRGQTNS